MLDAFNYPSPPFTRTGTPSITRASTPLPTVLGKTEGGKSNLALNMTSSNEEQPDVEGNAVAAARTERVQNGSSNVARDTATAENNTSADAKALEGGEEGKPGNGELLENAIEQRDEDKIAGFGGGKMQRKKVVEEPSAASILDNFNF